VTVCGWFRQAAVVGIAMLLLPSVANASYQDQAFARWAVRHAFPLHGVEPGAGVTDLRSLKALVGNARVVSLGEPAHGAHEPLAFRNRLFQYLVEELGFTAIVLESGLPESRRIHDYVTGAPDTLSKVVAENLSWGFGGFKENAALISWMREYNANPGHSRKINFYGMDLSLGGPTGSTPTPAALEAAMKYLDRVDPAESGRLRLSARPWMDQMPEGPDFTPGEHDRLTTVIEQVITMLERERPRYIGSGTESDYEWALRNALVARQADRMFRVSPVPATGGEIDPAAWRLVNARDSAMAANALWALEREGPGGKILVFAHNAHVMNAPITGGIWNAFEQPPRSMGMSLRASLTDDLIILATGGATNGPGLPPAPADSGSLDAVLMRVGPPIFLLDFRSARTDSGAASWLTKPRALRANFNTSLVLSPIQAFDAILFLERLTPAQTADVTGP
jgi:erythromycin esterase